MIMEDVVNVHILWKKEVVIGEDDYLTKKYITLIT